MKAELVTPVTKPDVVVTMTNEEAEILAKFLGWGATQAYRAYSDAVYEKNRVDPQKAQSVCYALFGALDRVGVNWG